MEVITLSEARDQIQIGSDLADSTITQIAESAEAWVSDYTGRQWSETSVTEYLDGGGRYLWPHKGPIVSVSEIATTVNGSEISTDLYKLLKADRVFHKYGRWEGGPDYYEITYTAGYGDTYEVPEDLRLAILQLTARWFDNRKGAASEGASGHNITWERLSGVDLMRTLNRYKCGELI